MRGVGEWVFKVGPRDTVRGFLWLNYEVERETDPAEGEDEFTAICVDLDVASSGDSWVSALHACRDAVMVTLNALEQEGMITEYLTRRGIRIQTGALPEALAGLGYPSPAAGGRFREPVVERDATAAM